MAKEDLSKYQKNLIHRYYDNLDTIMLQKLQALVSDLYIAETDKKRDMLWERAQKAMVQLKIPPAVVSHIMKRRDIKVLAKNLEDWLKGTG